MKDKKGNMKKFIITVASLVCFMIICTTVNVSLDKLTANAQADTGSNVNVSGNDAVITDDGTGNSAVIQQGTTDASDTTDAAQNTGSNNSAQPNATPNKTPSAPAATKPSGENPLNYNTAQLVAYYNNCLIKTYSQPSFTVTKTEKVDVSVQKLLLNGKEPSGIKKIVDGVVARNAKDKTDTKSFSNGNIADNERFILPTNLTAAGVASKSVSKSGSGYQIKFTLKAEKCDFTTFPPYNESCTFPLNFNEIDLGGLGQITSAQFNYPGTTLTINIDGNGRVVRTYVYMPLTVKNAEGQGMGQKISADISGRWLCTNVFSF